MELLSQAPTTGHYLSGPYRSGWKIDRGQCAAPGGYAFRAVTTWGRITRRHDNEEGQGVDTFIDVVMTLGCKAGVCARARHAGEPGDAVRAMIMEKVCGLQMWDRHGPVYR